MEVNIKMKIKFNVINLTFVFVQKENTVLFNCKVIFVDL